MTVVNIRSLSSNIELEEKQLNTSAESLIKSQCQFGTGK